MNQQNFVQQLMEFRTAYLRAVSRAAVDLEFRRKLTADGSNPLEILMKDFGYTCPWKLNFRLLNDPLLGPRLDQAAGVIMTLPYLGERIVVYIPKKPGNDPQLIMDALTAWYQQHPMLLQEGQADSSRMSNLPLPHPRQFEWTSVNANPDRNKRFDLGARFDEFISFGAAMFNLVALAWNNDAFFEQITEYTGQSSAQPGKAIRLLADWLGYKYPWQLDLVVQVDEHARYDAALGQWVDTTPPELTMTLPWMSEVGMHTTPAAAAEYEVAANRKNPGVAVMGVALYNTDGAGYPFTCG